MANAVYQKYKQSLFTEADSNKSLNQTGTNGVFSALIDTADAPYDAADQFWSDMLAGLVGTAQEITTPTVLLGTFDGDNVTYTAVTGDSVEAIVLYRKNSGADTTWRLVLYEDTGVTGLPVTPNGGNIIITWNGSGIFTISDRNLKENIREIGSLFDKLSIYEFNYNGNPQRHRGLMAQDVEKIVPHAVIEFARNRKAVNYDQVIEALAA